MVTLGEDIMLLIGGGVDGGKIHGTYPDDLSDDDPLGLGCGRLVPTSWEQVWNGHHQKVFWMI